MKKWVVRFEGNDGSAGAACPADDFRVTGGAVKNCVDVIICRNKANVVLCGESAVQDPKMPWWQPKNVAYLPKMWQEFQFGGSPQPLLRKTDRAPGEGIKLMGIAIFGEFCKLFASQKPPWEDNNWFWILGEQSAPPNAAKACSITRYLAYSNT